ncbi:MAG: FKBP-type peptidyl-prolyl cis-trans isomerase [Chlamydiales bacterium]|nr:FKBP-type peptidyl-prolyl cis-trans isomerase [Chlamydiia bacterium]MCP5506934.1 FKBP-type peptidyl-prolyl cis-trans isomerase [Chlamydiales bacterium]
MMVGGTLAAMYCAPCLASTSNTQENTHTSQTSNLDEVDIKLLSEAFGHFIGRNLNTPGVQFDVESIIKGMREGVAGKEPPMSDQEYETLMTKVQEEAYKKLSEDNLVAANEFMDQNKNTQGVVELEPGKLQYILLTEGNGPTVEADSTPMIHYTGKYLDGTTFGSSEEVGGPITIPLNQTIPGFSKGLVGMKEGEKRRLFVHPDLGYGTLGNLPPNALLVFDIDIVKADTRHGSAMDDSDDEDIISPETDETPDEEEY